MGMQLQPANSQFSPDQLATIKATVAKGTTDQEFKLFVEVCKYHALNPFARQIYAVVRVSRDGSRNLCIQTSIDGYRLLAERSGKYAGQMGPQWCGEDGQWVDVWLSSKPPAAARIGILRKDFQQPVWGVAKYASYAQSSPIWNKMPDVMLAKCAESLALRKAFPAEMSGIYTREEMEQADEELPTVDHSSHVVDSTSLSPKETPQNEPQMPEEKSSAPKAIYPDDLKKRFYAAYDRCKKLDLFFHGANSQDNLAAFYVFASRILEAKITAYQQLTASRLDAIEKHAAEYEASAQGKQPAAQATA